MLFIYLMIMFHSLACYLEGQGHLELSGNSLDKLLEVSRGG